MNIGIFTDTYFPQINGVSTSVKMLEKELNNLGHNVYIFTTSDPNSKDKFPRIFRLPSMPFIFLPSHRVALMYPPKLLLKVKKLDLDVVHTQTEFGIGFLGKIVAKVCKIPVVHTYHTMYEDYVHYFAGGHLITPKMAKRYMRNFCNRTDAVIAPVEKTKQSLIQSGTKKPIYVIPTGLDFDNLVTGRYSAEEIEEIRMELGLKKEDKVILFLGRVAKEKSIDVILRQMPKILEKETNAKFLIVGDGPWLGCLKKMSEELGVSDFVIFAGSKKWEDIGKYYQLAHLFTTASTSETQGLTYIEAMIARKPVVVKKDESIVDIVINNETGFYFEEEEEIADIIYHVLTDEEHTNKVVEKAFKSIQHLSAKQFAKNVESLYLKVIEETNDKLDGDDMSVAKINKGLFKLPKPMRYRKREK